MDKRERITKQMRRLPLVGTMNTRDLGGYPCENGVTRWGVFLRSDSPHSLTPGDIDTLHRYGVTSAVDLRSDGERDVMPTTLTSGAGFKSFHVSLSDQLNTADYEGDTPGTMAGLYISLLDNSATELAQIFRILAQTQEGTLFHCAVGKDRTGVVAMLLLQLAGVEEADIVADYAVTDTYMREVFDKRFSNIDIEDYRIRSLPDSMWRVLRHLREEYYSAERYLLEKGLSSWELSAIRNKFLEGE